jgi:hypothetical protein
LLEGAGAGLGLAEKISQVGWPGGLLAAGIGGALSLF